MKARRAHVVPLAPMAQALFQDALMRRRSEGDRSGLFASRFTTRETLARHSLSQALRRIIARMEPDGADAEAVRSLKESAPTPHDFRRTVATGMAALGIPREDRKAVLAHVEDDVHGRHYDKYQRLREKRIALETWERHVAEVLGDGRAEGSSLSMEGIARLENR
jgi:integrase